MILEGLVGGQDLIMVLEFTSTIEVGDFAVNFTYESEQPENIQKAEFNQLLFCFFGYVEGLVESRDYDVAGNIEVGPTGDK